MIACIVSMHAQVTQMLQMNDVHHVCETRLPIMRCEDPFTAVVHGAGKALDQISLLREVALT